LGVFGYFLGEAIPSMLQMFIYVFVGNLSCLFSKFIRGLFRETV